MSAALIIAYVSAWWFVGFAGALVAREAIKHLDVRILGRREPLTYGALLLLIFASFLGAGCWVGAIVWWLCEAAASDRAAWLGRPVFGDRVKRP